MTDSENERLEEKLRQFDNMATEESQAMDDCLTPDQTLSGHMDKQRRRNLIFDEERFEETFLKCLICRENYDDSLKLPKMLPCHHTFCLDCLCQMFRVEAEFRQSLTTAFRGMPMAVKIQCPSCRDGLITSEAELRRLPNDHTLMELLTFVKATGRSDVQYCAKHQLQPLNFFCEPCVQPVCRDCTVLDHKELKGHLVVNVEEALTKYTPILDDTLQDIRQQKEDLARQREALENAAQTVDQIQTDLTQTIRSVFDRIREAVDEREREMYEISDGEITRRREMIEGHLKTLGERETTLNSEFNGLQQAKDDRDISSMFRGHQEARQVLTQQVNVPTDCVKDFNVSFLYNARHDASIRQQVANLGNILFQG